MNIPDVGIAKRAETVEINRIGFERRRAQHRFGVTDAQSQQHLPAVKNQPVESGQQTPELALQCLRQGQQLGMGLGAPEHVGGAGRKSLSRDKMQQARAQRVDLPRGPGDEKIQTQAEAGFQNAPLRLTGPRLRQTAAFEKNFARLLQPAELAAVAVAEARTEGAAAWRTVR